MGLSWFVAMPKHMMVLLLMMMMTMTMIMTDVRTISKSRPALLGNTTV